MSARREEHRNLRVRLRNELDRISKLQKESQAEYSRQTDYDDVFTSFYGKATLPAQILTPAYLPGKMYEIYEGSSVQSCVDAHVHNVVGFGWKIIPKEGAEVGDNPDDHPEKIRLKSIFKQPNPFESWTTLARNLWLDYKVTGNGYLEVVRNANGEPSMIFWSDTKRMRLMGLDDKPTEVDMTIERDGVEIPIKVERRFRRFCQLHGTNLSEIRVFKSFGDTRRMDARTGRYEDDKDFDPDAGSYMEATEVIHIKNGTGTYGIPSWIGTVFNALGSHKAEFINYDLFDGQGIPALLIAIAGGQLTEESYKDLLAMFIKAKNYENFNKYLVLESEANAFDMQGKPLQPKLEITNMAEYRKEDAMFLNYLQDARKTIREHGFRLPGMFLGRTEDLRHETARITRQLAEEQLFVPEREFLDEIVNTCIVQPSGCKSFEFQTRAAVIKSSDELLEVMPVLAANAAITVNQMIDYANTHFGTAIPVYDEGEHPWASMPIPQALSVLVGAAQENMIEEEEIEKSVKVIDAMMQIRKMLDKGCDHECPEEA